MLLASGAKVHADHAADAEQDAEQPVRCDRNLGIKGGDRLVKGNPGDRSDKGPHQRTTGNRIDLEAKESDEELGD